MSDDTYPRDAFLALLPRIREVAKAHGYAIGVHGSLARDFDLIAAPWVEECTEPEVLAEAIRAALGGMWRKTDPRPQHKPQCRLGWCIYLQPLRKGDGLRYIDLSVMPRTNDELARLLAAFAKDMEAKLGSSDVLRQAEATISMLRASLRAESDARQMRCEERDAAVARLSVARRLAAELPAGWGYRERHFHTIDALRALLTATAPGGGG